MLKSKRFNGSMAAVVVLAVILAVAVTAGATLAWFTSRDDAAANFALGGAVVIAVADEKGALEDAKPLDLVIPAGKLVPGMTLYPTVYADVLQTTTPSLLRAKVDINVTVPETYATKHGIDEAEVSAQVSAIEGHLLNQFVAKANGWYFHGDDKTWGEGAAAVTVTADNWFYFVGNKEAYSHVMTAVADTVDSNNITESLYAVAGEGGPYADNPKDTTLPTNNQVASVLFYDLVEDGEKAGEQNLESPIVAGDTENPNGITVVGGQTYAHVPFMVRPFIVPIAWDNTVAELSIDITVTFEAVQDFLVDPENTTLDEVPQRITTLDWAQKVFEDASYVLVTFDANGGEGEVDQIKTKVGLTITLPEEGDLSGPTGSHVFVGWAENPLTEPDSEDIMFAGDEYVITSATSKLFAIWEEQE